MDDKPLLPGIVKAMEERGVPETIEELDATAKAVLEFMKAMRKPRLKVIEGGLSRPTEPEERTQGNLEHDTA